MYWYRFPIDLFAFTIYAYIHAANICLIAIANVISSLPQITRRLVIPLSDDDVLQKQ